MAELDWSGGPFWPKRMGKPPNNAGRPGMRSSTLFLPSLKVAQIGKWLLILPGDFYGGKLGDLEENLGF